VAAATALAVGSLVGGTLYVSSAGSEALQVQLERTCLGDAGAAFDIEDPADAARLTAAAASLAHVERPVVTRMITGVEHRRPSADAGVLPRLTLLSRDGQSESLGVRHLAAGEALVPEWAVADLAPRGTGTIEVQMPPTQLRQTPDGGFVSVDLPDRPLLTLTVVGSYPDIPVRPEPSFWCVQRDLLRPNTNGDPPPPMVLVASETLERLPVGVGVWELRPDPDGLRRDQARRLLSDYESLVQVLHPDEDPADLLPADDAPPIAGIGTLADRADRTAEFVARTIAPVRYAAALSALVLLVGAGVLVVRDQRRELRLRALRGVGPIGLASGQLRWMAPVTVTGAVAGALLAIAGVRLAGPTPELEPSSLRSALFLGTAGWLVCLLVAATVVGAVAAATVDHAAARRPARTWFVPELPLAVLAVWSFTRLDRIGGVQQAGTQIQGGDLVAQAFPLVSAVAAATLLTRPLRWLLRRLRRTGDRLPTPVMLGWRRVLAEPGVSVTIVAATALATAFAVQATSLTDSVARLMHDKSAVFVGSDLAVAVLDEPASTHDLGAAATVVERVQDRDPRSVEVLGIDPATFEAAAFWRGDAHDRSLGELIDSIELISTSGGAGRDGRVPALVIGGHLDTDVVQLGGGIDLAIRDVAAPAFFPGFRNGSTLVVVDRSAVAEAPGRVELWVRDPVGDVLPRLRDSGVRVTSAQDTGEIFEVTDFLSTRWGYASFTALGIVIAIVTLLGQLLVLDARRSSRRVAHVLVERMGMRRRGEAVAVGVEVGVPLVTGVLAGTAIGWAAARLATSRLDALRNLKPNAVLVVDAAALGAVGVAVLVVITVLALGTAVGLVRTRAMEVMRAVSTT
jgi:putative ABC transport system permease protein